MVKMVLRFNRQVLPPLLHSCICSDSFIPEFWFRWETDRQFIGTYMDLGLMSMGGIGGAVGGIFFDVAFPPPPLVLYLNRNSLSGATNIPTSSR